MYPKSVINSHFVTPPRAYNPNTFTPTGGVPVGTGPAGQVLVAAFSSTAQAVDLRQVVNPQQRDLANLNSNAGSGRGVQGNFVQLHAEGQDLYVILGAEKADVSGVSATARGTITASGTFQGATAMAFRIPEGQNYKFVPAPGVDNWLGLVASGSGTGTVRMYMSNPPNGGTIGG